MDFLAVEGLTKFFGGLAAVYQVGFTIQEGEIIGLIGPNGSGKTTVLNLITGFLKPNDGRVTLAGKDVTGLPPHRMCQNGVARTFQLTKSFPCCTVLQNVMIARTYGRDPAPNLRVAADEAMDILGVVGLADKANFLARDLTLMERKMLELARALAARPRLLLLDELMAGLNPAETEETMLLIRKIRDSGITILVVEHIVKAICLYSIHQQGYRYLFSPFPKSPAQARDVFEILNASIPEGERPTKVAIFQETTDWGIELGNLWKENAPKYGYQVVVYETYTPRTEDMSAMILKAKEAGAETLLTVPAPPDGITMVKQMVELGWTPKFALMIRAPENVTWAETLGKNGDYFTIFPGWHHAENFPGVAELNAKYQAQFGRPADLLTGPAYACVQIAAAAIEKAGTLDREAIRDAIAATNMTTVIGPVTFNTDGTGNVLNPLIQWQNGKQELVWPPEHASAKLVYPAPPFDKR